MTGHIYFLGIGGTRVSSDEQEALNQLGDVLGVRPTTPGS